MEDKLFEGVAETQLYIPLSARLRVEEVTEYFFDTKSLELEDLATRRQHPEGLQQIHDDRIGGATTTSTRWRAPTRPNTLPATS